MVWGLWSRLGLPFLDAAFMGALLALLPVLAVAQIPLAVEARLERVPAYAASALTISLLGAAATFLGGRSIGWESMGLVAPGLLPLVAWSAGLTLAAALLVLAVHALRHTLGIRESPLLRELLPRSTTEKRLFVGLSFAAGFGEEIAFRGYALPLLAPHLGGLWGAALFTSLVFGLLHAYQGPVGMARTSLLGLLMAASFILSGSLWPAIVAHVSIDLMGGLVWGERLSK